MKALFGLPSFLPPRGPRAVGATGFEMLTHVRFLVLVLLLNVYGGLQSLDYTTLRLSTAELSQQPVLVTKGEGL